MQSQAVVVHCLCGVAEQHKHNGWYENSGAISTLYTLPAPRKRWQMTDGLFLYASRALACLPGPRDCIMTEDEVIMQHKERTGAKILIRRGRKKKEAGGTRECSRLAQSSAGNSICVRLYLRRTTLQHNHLRRRDVP